MRFYDISWSIVGRKIQILNMKEHLLLWKPHNWPFLNCWLLYGIWRTKKEAIEDQIFNLLRLTVVNVKSFSTRLDCFDDELISVHKQTVLLVHLQSSVIHAHHPLSSLARLWTNGLRRRVVFYLLYNKSDISEAVPRLSKEVVIRRVFFTRI